MTETPDGDFDGDSFSDILWQNASSGQASVWEMVWERAGRRRARQPKSRAGLKAIGSGDFDGDSHSDILWQNTSTGQVSIWNDGSARNWAAAPSPLRCQSRRCLGDDTLR